MVSGAIAAPLTTAARLRSGPSTGETPRKERTMQTALKVGLKISVTGTTNNPLDTTYVVERIRRIPSPTAPTRYLIEARSERQRCFDRRLTGSTTWDLASMQDCFKAGTMAACPCDADGELVGKV
jgi:hypothetical protein